jgi:hypothetical protein
VETPVEGILTIAGTQATAGKSSIVHTTTASWGLKKSKCSNNIPSAVSQQTTEAIGASWAAALAEMLAT